MIKSEQIGQIAAALAAAQAELQNPAKEKQARIEKEGKRPYTYTYADFATALEAIRPVTAKHGLAIIQAPRIEGQMIVLDTIIAHKSGEYVGNEYPVGPGNLEHRVIGSALSYSRRYSLFSLLGIQGEDEDDDGQADQDARRRPPSPPANGGQAGTKPPSPPPAPEKTVMGQECLKAIQDAKTKEAFDEAIAKAREARARMTKAEEDAISAVAKKRKAEFEAKPTAAKPDDKPASEEGEATKAAKEYDALRKTLKLCQSPDACDEWSNAYAARIDALPAYYKENLMAIWDKTRDGEV